MSDDNPAARDGDNHVPEPKLERADEVGKGTPTPEQPASRKETAKGVKPGPDHVAAPKPDIDSMFEVNQNFYGPVSAGHIGVADAIGGQTKPREGRIDDDEIADNLRNYRPMPCYDDAAAALVQAHVVVLYGPSGIGKRASAISLIRECTANRVVQLSPVHTLKQLARLEYTAGYGYVLPDRQEEATEPETEFNWRTVRDQVKDAGAFLVITTTKVRVLTECVVVHVRWQKPEIGPWVRAVLGAAATDALVKDVSGRIDMDTPMRAVTPAVRRVADWMPPDEAFRDLGLSSVSDVGRWFSNGRVRGEILNMTTLAFVEGVSRRDFEELRDQLEAALIDYDVVRKAKRRKAEVDTIPARRAALTTGTGEDESLVEIIRGSAVTQPRTPRFRKREYRRQVLSVLWDSHEVPFWNAIRDWSHGLAATGFYVHIWGVAHLAAVDVGEAEESYLEPWSKGLAGWQGQHAAVYTLWAMCFDDVTAPAALRVARRWARCKHPGQRWTAAMAFGGILGATYPSESMRQVWYLIASTRDGIDACFAMGYLFAALTARTDQAGRVLKLLEDRLAEALKPPPPNRERNARLMELTLEAIEAVVSVRDPRSRRSSMFTYLHAQPDRARDAVRLWVVLLRNTNRRSAALTAIWRGVRKLPDISHTPTVDAKVFADALASHLSVAEQVALRQDLITTDQRMRRNRNEKYISVVLAEVIQRLRPHLSIGSSQ